MNKYYIRTYDNGVHSIMALDIMEALQGYMAFTGRTAQTVYSIIDAAEVDR